MPLDLLAFIVTILLMFFQGVPRVRRNVWLPVNLDFEPIEDAQLTEKQKKYYEDIGATLAKMGFYPAVTYKVNNIQGANMSRSYLNSLEPTLVNAVLVGTAANRPPINTYYLEFITRFKDGTVLTTINSHTTSVFDLLPGRIRQKFKGLKDAEELKRRHNQKLEELRDRGVVYYKKEDILTRHAEYHGQFLKYQMFRGLLRFDPTAQLYRATTKTAMRGVVNYLNPFDAGFHWAVLFWVLLLGGAVPTAGLYYCQPIVQWAYAQTGINPAQLVWPFLIALFALGGLATGYLFSRRVFVWGFLLAYVPMRALTLLHLMAFDFRYVYLSVLLSYVAEKVSLWRRKREKII